MKPPTNAQLAAMTREQLAVCYLHWVGYDPFVDSPSISHETVLDTLIGYFAEFNLAGRPPGWSLIETGGGCTALWREHDHDHEWLITKVDDPSAPDDANEPCTLGLSDDGTTIVFWTCSCLAEALQIAEGAKTL